MKLISARWSVLAAMGCVMAAGCAKNSPPQTMPATGPVQSSMVVDALSPGAARSREISRLSAEYSELSHQLPGRTPDEHRQMMHDVLARLDLILLLLADPQGDLAMQQNLETLEDARNQLVDGAAPSVIEPAVDTGLRSAYTALIRIAADKDFGDQDFSEPMKEFKSRLDELDLVHGLTQQVVAAEAVDASTPIISKMADVFASRIAPASEATTAPSTEPATAPASGSATTQQSSPSPATTLPTTTAPAN